MSKNCITTSSYLSFGSHPAVCWLLNESVFSFTIFTILSLIQVSCSSSQASSSQPSAFSCFQMQVPLIEKMQAVKPILSFVLSSPVCPVSAKITSPPDSYSAAECPGAFSDEALKILRGNIRFVSNFASAGSGEPGAEDWEGVDTAIQEATGIDHEDAAKHEVRLPHEVSLSILALH